MFKKNIVFAVIATFSLTMIISCKKNNVPIAESKENTAIISKKLSSTVSLDDAANPNNQYDDIGYNHNIALQATRTVWSNKASTAQDDYNAMVDYCKKNGYPTDVTYTALANMVVSVNMDNTVGKSDYVKTIGLSDLASSYATQLFSITQDASSFTSYKDFKVAVIGLENKIQSDRMISDDERKRLLSGASVARHSILYWAREGAGFNANFETNGNPNIDMPDGIFGTIHDWLHLHPIATADIGGACGGGAVGGILGALLGAAGGSIVAWGLQ